MLQELMLDVRQEILNIIDKESHKYKHITPYVSFDDAGCVTGCCINGLVMLSMGWKPTPNSYAGEDGLRTSGWNYIANKMRRRYGEDTITEINNINTLSMGWKEARNGLQRAWPGTK
jgi:hypothetical protein